MGAIEFFIEFFVAVAKILQVLFIIYYLLSALLLYKLNKAMYGEGTLFAFIPFAHIYLLGKLTVNKVVGFCLALFAAFDVFILIFDIQNDILIDIFDKLTGFYLIFIFILTLSAFIRYTYLKNNK